MANFKSVLEKYDAKGNRRLPTAEEDAIKPDTTLEGLLIGSGRAAASTIKNAINKRVQSRKFDTPEIGSGLPPPNLDLWKNIGGKSPKEILAEQEARGNTVLMKKAAEQAANKGLRLGYGEMAGRVMNDAGMPTYKKGGSVSSRADGIAQRGKTKGRMC
jgi:hypothetical protein